MKTLIVYAHPEPRSFNAALRDAAVATLSARGWPVQVTDLYADRFDPVAGPADFVALEKPEFFRLQGEQFHASKHGGFADDVQRELAKVLWCELLILQFPTWWFAAPAILKGWIDRVMVAGAVYDGWAGKLYDQGGLQGRRALVSTTVGGVDTMYRADGLNGVDIVDCHRSLLYGVLYFSGCTVLAPNVVYGPARLDAGERARAIDAYRSRLARIELEEPFQYPKLADFDERFVRRAQAAAPRRE